MLTSSLKILFLLLTLTLLAQTQTGPVKKAASLTDEERYSQILTADYSRELELDFYRKLLDSYRSTAIQHLGNADRSLKEKRMDQAVGWLQRAAIFLSHLSNEGSPTIVALRDAAAAKGRQYPQDSETREAYVLIPPKDRRGLKRLAAETRQFSTQVSSGKTILPLNDFEQTLNGVVPFLQLRSQPEFQFQPATSTGKVLAESVGGHASAMGPAPAQISPEEDIRRLAGTSAANLNFEEMPVFPEKTFCGGTTKDHLLESGGSGVALLDYDNDGWLDIYLVNAKELNARKEAIPHRNLLYRNLGNWKFEEVAKQAGLDAAAWGNGVCTGDYDNDGTLDIFVSNFGSNSLFRNNGNGTFRDVAGESGVARPGWNTGCTFFDADADGDLDLYVAGYVTSKWEEVVRADRTLIWRGGPHVMFGPAGLPGAPDVFFRNEGNGKFTDQTAPAGLSDLKGAYGFGVLATDYNDDGKVDLYVANDSNPNFLFRNWGGLHFKEEGLTSGTALSADGRAQAGMGVDSGDYDGDGVLDIIVTNFSNDYNTLYRNLGGGLFEDASRAAGLYARTFQQLSWGATFFDADLDGDLDLFFANGHIYPQVDEYPHLQESFRQKNQLMVNDRGSYRDVSSAAGSGLQVAESSRGLAVGDLDNDGDLDLVITNMDAPPSVLQNRTQTSNHWIGFSLRKAGQNRFCIGARITVSANGRKQVREVRSGGSYLSQSDLRVYFGLGRHRGPVDVEVRMPGGQKWEWKELAIDRISSLELR